MLFYLSLLLPLLALGRVGWLVSIKLHNVNLVDSLWAVFMALSTVAAACVAGSGTLRMWLVLAMVLAWMLRLSGHLSWRNWGKAEDHRYQAIRRNNKPFVWKSLYIVFGLQAVLAWVVALPADYAAVHMAPLGALAWLGVALWLFGFVFEAVADWQLARFRSNPQNNGTVLSTGLWRHSRHPNYFGEFCVWWGIFGVAADAGGWWTVVSPLLMTFLLLKVSGVALMERTITTGRPKYADYIKRTNAFFPGRRRG